MAAPKGTRPPGGSRKDKPNKLTVAAREAFQMAFDEIGGPKELAAWARLNQTDFYKLFSKLIPQTVEASVALADVSDKPLSEDEWAKQTPG